MRIQWHSGHAVGFPTIDSQQQELVRRVNKLADAIRAGRVEEVAARLDLVRGAAAVQFAEEEARLRAAGDRSFVRHRHEHLRLLEDLDALAEALEARGVDALREARVASWLPAWIDVHAARTHRELAALGGLVSAPSLPARVAAQKVP
jgi:hemerythrin-like metal-binding protein